jgi:chemotaxis protein CheX
MQTILASACDLGLTAEPNDESVRQGKIVLGMVSIQGEVHWSVALGFTQSSASAVASRFAGYEIPSEGPDLGDAIGEIANIVAGRIKHDLGAKHLAVNISLPTVIWAEAFQVLLQHNTAMDYAHFNSEAGKIWTMVAVGIDNGIML